MAILYGTNAALARARLLTDCRWTPIRDVPTYTKEDGYCVLPAGEEVAGFPYAGSELCDKFIGENVSIETFLSAVSNPDSVLYRPGRGSWGTGEYGIVCNGFVRYALGIPERVPTRIWNGIPGIRTVAPKGEYSVDEMVLCDVLHAFNDGRNHVAMITHLVRDEAGHVTQVEVSEAARPCCKRRRFTPEEYYEKYKVFALQRYEYLDSVPPFDEEKCRALLASGIDKNRPKIAVDNGEKANYLLGTPVTVSVFADAPDTVLLLKDGEAVAEYPVGTRAFFPLALDRGYYTVRLKEAGDEARFAVVGAEISHTVAGDEITVTFDSCDPKSTALHLDFRMAGERYASLAAWTRLTDDERKSGSFTRKIPEDGKNYKLSFENEYGIWVHPMTKIR